MLSLTASDRSATYLSVVLLSPPTGYYSASRILCVVSRVSCTPCHHSAVLRVVLPYLLPLSPSVVLTCKPLPCPRTHTHPSPPLPYIRSPSSDACSRRRASRLSRIGKSGSRSSSPMLGSCSFRRMTEDLCSPNMSNRGYVMSSLSGVSISVKAPDPTPKVYYGFARTSCR